MASKTDIGNRALSKLGEARVSNFDNTNNEKARVINDMYEIVRDDLIASFPWNFAIQRAELAEDPTAPIYGFQKKYQVPSDFLALLDIRDRPDYRFEGSYILTDEGAPIFIRYIRQITNEGDFDAVFTEAFASRLALEACEQITQSNTKKQLLTQEYEANISRAYSNDSIQNPPQELVDDEWLLARESSVAEVSINFNVIE